MKNLSFVSIFIVMVVMGCKNSSEGKIYHDASSKPNQLSELGKFYDKLNTEASSADFDFLIGEWEINSKRLKERLVGDNDWIESKAHSKCWKILDGNGNMDEFSMTTKDGRQYVGNTIRVYNPNTKEWTLYWVDNFNLDLGVTYQTQGVFKDGIGTFNGEEMYEGKKVKQKFTWKKIDENTCYWDQGYFDDTSGDWEINWIMEFKRVSL